MQLPGSGIWELDMRAQHDSQWRQASSGSAADLIVEVGDLAPGTKYFFKCREGTQSDLPSCLHAENNQAATALVLGRLLAALQGTGKDRLVMPPPGWWLPQALCIIRS